VLEWRRERPHDKTAQDWELQGGSVKGGD